MTTLNENGDLAHVVESPNLEFFSRWAGGKKFGEKGETPLTFFDVPFTKLLDRMWEEDPEMCLKSIFYKGDCRGGAKEKRLFQVALHWLGLAHEKTLKANIQHVPEYRTWKDLLYVYQLAEEEVLDAFANQLREDLRAMQSLSPREDVPSDHPSSENPSSENPSSENPPGEEKKEVKSVSLCAKWVPTEGTKFDVQSGNFLSKLAARLNVDLKGLRKTYITPLRKHIRIVENLMCKKEWDKIEYSKVPSVAMQTYRKIFQKRDPVRFAEWRKALIRGEAKVNVSQLFPHTVLAPYFGHGPIDDLIEAQFSALVENTKKMGCFSRSMVLVDTSGSMSGTPIQVAISLGILMSRCLAPPLTGTMISFSEEPSFFVLEGKSARDDIEKIERSSVGLNTNIDAVFNVLLTKADEMVLTPEEMPTRLYILTDMQFDQACVSEKTAFGRMKDEFVKRGYAFPEIVCWNLRSSIASSANSDREEGICNITGFTPDVLSVVMKGKIPNPLELMKETLAQERYARLRVVE